MAKLFFDTVRSVNRRDYSAEQINAWAPRLGTAEEWLARQAGKMAYVAVEKGQIVGFAEIESNGHIDCFYTHRDLQSQGIGTLLFEAIEAYARALEIATLFAEVSITARTFFEHRGFRSLREQHVVRRGVTLTNYVMEKALASPTGPIGRDRASL